MEKKLGLFGLIAMVVGSMVGSGIFQLPAEMANSCGPLSAIIAWIITGIGMFFIGKVFQILSNKRPDLYDGIYTYSREGFGSYVGFLSAWGYWFSHLLGNVSYIVLFIYALHNFFPQIGSLNSLPSLIISIIMIWGIIFIIAKSMKIANGLNEITTIAKIIPVILSIILLFVCFKFSTFSHDLFATHLLNNNGQALGSIGHQINNGFLNTIWVFVGIESAVVISERAKNPKDVGKATIIGYLFTLVCYVLIVLLSFGALGHSALVNLQNPALGGVLQKTYGTWAAVIIDIGVLISVLGAWVAWNIINAEVPMTVARDRVFPRILGKKLKSGAAINALILNAIIMQIIFIFAMFANNAFTLVTNIATAMVLLPYLLSALFLVKLAKKDGEKRNLLYGILAAVFAIFSISTAGITGIAQILILYSLGLIFLIIRAVENKEKMFNKKWELVLCSIITILGLLSIVYFFIIK
ncbi:MAG: basic amino acid/polyamine antiporter [Sarcina sp.]